jgi:hypothetical protein
MFILNTTSMELSQRQWICRTPEGVLTRRFVYPDIIVHQSGHDRENLLVIEVKKTTNPTSDDAGIRMMTVPSPLKGKELAKFAYLLMVPNRIDSPTAIRC